MSKKAKNWIKRLFFFIMIISATISSAYLFYVRTFNENIVDNYAEFIYKNNSLTLDNIYKIRNDKGLALKIYDYTNGKIISLENDFFQTGIKFKIKDENGDIKESTINESFISIINIENKTIEDVRKVSGDDFVIYPSHGGTIYNKRTASINSFTGCQIYVIQYSSKFNNTYNVLILENNE